MTTVRARLTLFTICVVAVSLVLLGLFLRFRVEANLLGEVDRALREDVVGASTGPLPPDVKISAPKLPTKIELDQHSESRMMQVVRTDQGTVHLDRRWKGPKLVPAISASLPVVSVDDIEGLRETGRTSHFHDFRVGGEWARSLTVPLWENGKLIAFAQSVRSLEPVHEGVRDLDRALLASIPVALLLAALGGFVTVGRAMRPLRRMIGAAEHLERSGARLPVEGRDEFAELAGALNAAFERQNRALAQLERFTGDAGHELRTPLASIKINASYLRHVANAPAELQPTLRTIDVSADRMARLINDLLLLAHHDGGGVVGRREAMDVGELVTAAVEALDVRPGVSVEVAGLPVDKAEVDPDWVERVLQNLLTNARDHACERVLVTASQEADFLILEVRDDGQGLAPEHLARLGERFFRPDEARSRQRGGVGLGVAIARSLCEAHGGDLTYESRFGEGTTARARFRIIEGQPES